MKIVKLLFKLIVLVIVFVFVWYSIGRLLSNHNSINSYVISEGLEVEDSTSLSVMAFNIAHGRGNKLGASNWQENSLSDLKLHLSDIAVEIRSNDPDILVLNEVDFSSVWSHHFNQARYIAEQAGFQYVVEQRNIDVTIPFVKYQFGNAILSKYPLEDASLVQHQPLSILENLFVGNHDAAYAVASTPFGNIAVVAIHLDYRNEDIRLAAVKQLINISKESGLPLIALGDFNSTPTGYPESRSTQASENAISYLLSETEFNTDVKIGNQSKSYTFPTESPDRVIDWVFANRLLVVTNVRVIQSDLSDHLPVAAQIDFSEQTTPLN